MSAAVTVFVRLDIRLDTPGNCCKLFNDKRDAAWMARRTAWTMPAEWEPHERTWMAWPPGDDDQAHDAWANVANAIVEFEPVTMVVDPKSIRTAERRLDPRVELTFAELDDAWMRDIGPTFVHDADGGVAGVDWVFNGWGGQEWAAWDNDARVAERVLELARVPRIQSPVTNEGGGIHVNGNGTVLVTQTVQLDPGRNPDSTAGDIEAELRRTLGVRDVVWLDRGLTRDYERLGTRGHVDIVASFCNPTTVLVHQQQNPYHPDYDVSIRACDTLRQAGFEVIPVPAPVKVRDDHGWVDYSYINHYVCNGGVIACAFDDPNDLVARDIIAAAYPGRKVIQVDARELFARGGGIHCITQQQPAPKRLTPSGGEQ